MIIIFPLYSKGPSIRHIQRDTPLQRDSIAHSTRQIFFKLVSICKASIFIYDFKIEQHRNKGLFCQYLTVNRQI